MYHCESFHIRRRGAAVPQFGVICLAQFSFLSLPSEPSAVCQVPSWSICKSASRHGIRVGLRKGRVVCRAVGGKPSDPNFVRVVVTIEICMKHLRVRLWV